MTSAADIEEHASRFLLRKEEPDWTDEDQMALDAWLDESIEHKVAFYRLEYGWKKVERLASLRAAVTPPLKRTLFVRSWVHTAIAASIAAAVLLSPSIINRVGYGRTTYATGIGGAETVPLRDGTRIELNTDTKLRTSVDANSRKVWLDRGEAYFQVAHDAEHPFVIFAGLRKVTVLGTKFSVRRDSDRVTVAVVEGRVRVDPEGTRHGAPEIVTRGETVIAQGPSTLVASKSVEKVADELSWRRGMLTFDQTTLAAAAAEFNRYNTRKLVITDPATARSRIGGTFEADNVEAFAQLLQSAYGLKVDETGNEVKISR